MNNKLYTKYLFTGAQGTGKTSLIEALPLPINMQKLKGITRKVINEKNLTINEYSDNCTQKHIFDAYERQLTSNDNYIAERSLVDVCAYTWYLVKQGKCSSTLLEYQLSKLEKFIANNPKTVHIYLRIEFDIIEDGTRSLNKEFQSDVDYYIQEILAKYNINYVMVTGSVEERVEQINKVFSYSGWIND